EMPFNYRWNTRFIYMDTIESVSEIKKYRRHWQQKVRGFFSQLFQTNSGVVNLDAAEMVGQADIALAEANSSVVKYGYYSNTIIIMDEDQDKLEAYCRETRKIVQQLGFTASIEGVNCVEAWLGSLPGQSKPNVRRPMLHTMHLSDMLPLTAIWPGSEFCPSKKFPDNSPALMHCSTVGATPFRLNLHVDDLGHTLVIGPTGTGKSTLLGIIAAQFCRYPGAKVFAFDKGNSLLPLTKAVGGLHFDIGHDDSKLAFCPLKYVTSDSQQAWAEGWIETLVSLQGVTVTPRHKNEIHNAMTLIKQSGHDGRSMTDFVTNLQDKELSEALKHYTVSGAMGHLLDAEDDGLDVSRFVTFEIEELMDMGEKNMVPVLLYLFHRFELSLDGSPTLLVLDEAWLMLGNAVFREKIREWLKVLRKANVAVIMATQSVSDAVNSGIIDVLKESCLTKILLPNDVAQEKGSREFYEFLGLNSCQLNIITHATRKRDYYYMSPLGKRLFNLNLGPYALAFVGASSKEEIARVRTLENEFGDSWTDQWLKERGVNMNLPQFHGHF
ncbi:conjugal transfer protein TrbE, partial [Solemya pervernicosa gill symbiont]